MRLDRSAVGAETTMARPPPDVFNGVARTVTAIAAGYNHSCAIHASATLGV
jgi:hypothetical protein